MMTRSSVTRRARWDNFVGVSASGGSEFNL
jgi:hypothetical protein